MEGRNVHRHDVLEYQITNFSGIVKFPATPARASMVSLYWSWTWPLSVRSTRFKIDIGFCIQCLNDFMENSCIRLVDVWHCDYLTNSQIQSWLNFYLSYFRFFEIQAFSTVKFATWWQWRGTASVPFSCLFSTDDNQEQPLLDQPTHWQKQWCSDLQNALHMQWNL